MLPPRPWEDLSESAATSAGDLSSRSNIVRAYCADLRSAAIRLPVVILVIVLVLATLGFSPRDLVELVGGITCLMGLTYGSQAVCTSLPPSP
jgi:hypothetical protein